MANDLFEGALLIEAAEQRIATRAQRLLIRHAFGDGADVPAEVRFACRIAMDVNEALSLAGHMPRLSEFTNQLIPQLLQIRVHADHSSQSLHLSHPPPPT